ISGGALALLGAALLTLGARGDVAADSLVDTVGVGVAPSGVAITLDGTQAYVTNLGSDDLSVIDTDSGAVIATIPAGVTPMEVAITPDQTVAYVTNISAGTVSVIDLAAAGVVETIPVGLDP